jgi:hypothetical protein
MSEGLAEAVEARARAGFPRPQTLGEWRSWLTNEALVCVYRGVQQGNAAPYVRVLFLLKLLAGLVTHGVKVSSDIPALPEYLFDPHAAKVLREYSSTAGAKQEEQAYHDLLVPLDQKLCFSMFLPERCLDEGLLYPNNMREWLAMLINEGCLMVSNTSSCEGEYSQEDNLHTIEMALSVFRCVSQLMDRDIQPARTISPFPVLRR